MIVDATVYTCECGKNIIILDEGFENAEVDSDDIQCPVCGENMISAMERTIEIKKC